MSDILKQHASDTNLKIHELWTQGLILPFSISRAVLYLEKIKTACLFLKLFAFVEIKKRDTLF
jgi:hypothetical protein